MVKVFPGSPINLESILKITEGQLALIKANEKKIKAFCKDHHVSHTYYTDEGGTNVSKIGINIADENMIEDTIKDIKEKHNKLIAFVDSLDKPNDKGNVCLTMTETEKGIIVEGDIHPLRAAFLLFTMYHENREKYDSNK